MFIFFLKNIIPIECWYGRLANTFQKIFNLCWRWHFKKIPIKTKPVSILFSNLFCVCRLLKLKVEVRGRERIQEAIHCWHCTQLMDDSREFVILLKAVGSIAVDFGSPHFSGDFFFFFFNLSVMYSLHWVYRIWFVGQ